MKILDRYLIRSFVVPFLLCLIFFSFIAMVIDLFNRLEEILKYAIPLSVLYRYYGAFGPITFVETSPMALLLAALYSLGLLNKRHEIRAMRSSGLSLLQIVGPYLFIGFLVVVVSFIVNETVVPKAVEQLVVLEDHLGPPKTKQKLVLENVALLGRDNRLYYASVYDTRKKELKDLVILEDDAAYRPVSKTWAKRAFWADAHWILLNGFKTPLDPQGRLSGEPHYFKKERLEGLVRPEDFLKTKRQTETMTYQELKNYLHRLEKKASASVIKRLQVDLYRKIAYPFSNLVILLIGFPFILVERRKAGALLGIGIAIALSFAFYTAFAIGSALGKGGILPPLLSVWLANIIFATAGLVLLRRVV